MRSTKFAAAVLALVLFGLGLPAGTARAEGPSDGRSPTVLQGVSLTSQLPGHSTFTLSARLLTGDGTPERGAQVLFYELSTVFGEQLMMLGSAVTDATGTASLPYEPASRGQHTVVVRYAGNGVRTPAQTILRFDSMAPPHVHENASFGLATPRKWAPLGAGLAVLGVWAVLGLVLMRTVLGIAAAPDAGSATTAWTRYPRPLPVPAALKSPLIPGLAALAAIALLVGLVVPRTRGSEPSVAASPVPSHDHDTRTVALAAGAAASSGEDGVQNGPVIAAHLVQSIPAFSTDEEGNVAPDSPDLPAGVAVVNNHIFVLDTNRGRVLTVAADGHLARIFESDPDGQTSVAHAVAMTVHDGNVLVAAPLLGNVIELSTAGLVEGVIQPRLPKAARPFRPAGIAVTARGDIWLSDSNNDRVVLVSGSGTPLATIGGGTAGAGSNDLDMPGGIALDEFGHLWVVDTGNHELKEYSLEGTFLTSIGRDALSAPQDVAVDGSGRIFVTDQALREVRVFGPDGLFLGSIGTSGATDGGGADAGLQYPRGIAIDGDRIYVMDRLSGMFVFELGAQ
jgi:sugar lactone lactonase YvrE